MPIGSNILAGASGQATGYDIENSLRFNDDDSAYLSRTPSSAGNRKTWTFSCWVKLSKLSGDQFLFSAGTGNAGWTDLIRFGDGTQNRLHMVLVTGSSPESQLRLDRTFRDPSAWQHILCVWDSSNATSSERARIYINGERVTDFSQEVYPSLNHDSYFINTATAHNIGRSTYSGSEFYDGYLAEVYFIDGQALTPASFGETNEDTNQWQAIEYDGSYGTNGFYLKFQDSAALGDDSSGNTNDFSATNLVATDQMIDTPTNNYCTFNPLQTSRTSGVTLSEGNLKLTSDGYYKGAISTIAVNSGKWYWELCNVATDYFQTGFTTIKDFTTVTGSDYAQGQYIYNQSNGTSIEGYGTLSVSGGSNTITADSNGDIIQFALDLDNGRFYVGKNGTWINSSNPATGTNYFYGDWYTAGNYYSPFTTNGPSSNQIYNFGQDSSFAGNKTAQGNTDGNGKGDFYHSVPSGYLALCSDNLSDPSIADPTVHFNTVLYTGNGSTQSITGVGFSPSLNWTKERSSTSGHRLTDIVRGNTKILESDNTSAENTDSISITSFDSDGFSVGTNTHHNQSSQTYVAWNWKAGGTASSNTDGTITSSVSANTTAGFSIVSYTGNGTNGATVGHGLSQNPNLAIVKKRESNGADGVRSWIVSGDEVSNWTYLLSLNQTAASWANAAISSPTSSTLTLSTEQAANYSGDTYIMYCFHSVDGYSKVGSYTGNGSLDGAFIYTGFRVSWVLCKSTASAQSWRMVDSERSPYNTTNAYLKASGSDAESTGMNIDLVSNGFKLRTTSGGVNNSETYIYLAFAESPFKTSNAR